MIFAVCQVMEKLWENRSKTFFLFIDLRKAYDSVPREALWQVLVKLGVPDPTIQLITDSIKTCKPLRIHLDGQTLE